MMISLSVSLYSPMAACEMGVGQVSVTLDAELLSGSAWFRLSLKPAPSAPCQSRWSDGKQPRGLFTRSLDLVSVLSG
jgi:hypothetical protein